LTDSPELNIDGKELLLPILTEELDIQKRTNVTGVVRLEKTVRTAEAIVEEELFKESISVEYVPVNRYVDEIVETRHEGDTMIIPVLEEVVIITKQLVLKEEIHITRRREQSRYHGTVPLRTEEVEVQRLEPR
jgi:uncharacterized protein (TIGR02271 family)